MFTSKLKTILHSDFDFFYLFLFIILILACHFNYFWIFILITLIIKLKEYRYLKQTLLIAVIFILLTTAKFFLPFLENNLFYTVSSNDSYTILDRAIVYDKLDANSIYYIEGSKEAISLPRVIGEFNYRNYYLSKNICYSIETTKIKKLGEFKLLNYINNLFINKPDLERSYLETILLANNKIAPESMKIYEDLGVSHLFSVSGLHITIFAFILNNLFKRITKKKYQKLTCFCLLLYILLSAFRISVIRASLLFILDYNFSKRNLEIPKLDVLSMSGLIILFFYPFAFLDKGFILSYLVSLVFIVGYKFMKGFTVAIVCYLVTLPIVVSISSSFSLMSPLLNIIYPIFFSSYFIFIAIINALGLDFYHLFVTSILLLERVSLFLSHYNVIFKIGKSHIVFLFLYYYLLYKFFVRLEQSKNGLWQFCIQVLIIFIIAYNLRIPKIVIIDVNQGSSYYIQKENVLIDTGGVYYTNITKKRVLPLLDFYGTKKIALILTHFHFDHYGGYRDIVDNYYTKTYISMYNKKLIKLVGSDSYQMVKLYDKINKNLLVCGPTKFYENENNKSLVLSYNFYGQKIIFPGDSELKLYPKCDILIMPHHGSKNAFDEKCYLATKPKVAIISSGKYSEKHLPSKEVVDLLKFYQVNIYNTSDSGSIYIIHFFKNYILNNLEFNLLYGNIL